MGNNELKIFENSEFGSVRVIVVDSEPWLVGKDVALALGYSNPQKALRDHVDDEDKTVNDSFTVNGTMGTLINESGLFSLALSSKLPSAKKFKRWVTSEVLTSIRKHGGYLYGQEQMTDEEMLCASLLFAQKKIEDRDRKIASLEKEKALLTKEVLSWRDEPLLNALVRKYAHEACGGNFACGWKSLFKELLYQHGINLESRKAQFKLHNPDKGAGATYKFLKQSEMPLAFSSITALCEKRGVDISALLEKKAG